MANISAIKLPNGTTYTLKDNGALQLTGGQVTGPVSFGDSVSIDEATLGDLVVNGSASFTNNLQANTINGVVVGNSPKFTDTITTASTTGSGNAVTAITASSGVLTVTKGTTFLTSHQDISGKADKSATVSTVAYDSTNKKITKTINGTTSDVVTVATLKTALGYTASDVGALPSNTTYVSKITTTAGTHSAISSKSGAVSFNVPTKTSHLTNDSGFLTSHQTIYESKINWGNTGISGNVTPMGASLSSEHSANRIAYLNPAAIQIEYTTNGGSSWTDSGYSDTEKTWLCTGSQSIAVGQSKSGYSQSTALTTNHWTRITLTGQNGTNTYVYTAPRKLLVNMSTAVGVECLVEYKTGASGASWQTFGTYTVSGWSGWNDIPLVLSTFGGGTTQTTNYWYLRFTFKVTSTRTDSYKGMSFVLGLRLFGSNDWASASSANGKGPFSSTGHLYSYDVGANATFPAKVTATGGFSGNVTGTATGNLTSVQYDSTNAKLTYTKNGSNTDIVTVATLKSALGSMPASDVYSWAKASSKPTYTASEVGAAASTHAHGNITSGGDITATAPTIANGDQIIINDNSASKITNGPTFDGSTTTKALTPKGTWETFLKSYTETDPTVPSWAKASSKPSYTASEVGAVPTSRTVNGKALSSNIILSASDVSALYEGTLSMSGLTAYSSRCVVSAGGYFKIGTMVFIQLRATNSGSLGSNNTWRYIDGFPIPTANSAAISAYASQNYGNISAIINNVGRLVIATGGSALAANTDMYFAGWYMASS